MRANDPGRSVTSRVLAILEVFERHGPALPLTQSAEHSGLSLSTAHRLVGELQEWGALTRDGQGRYQVGLRLWELSQNAERRLRDTSRPYLQDLFSLTQETSHLAIRDGNEALYVDRLYSSKRVPRASRIGGRLPLHTAAVGKVLLAYEEQWFREAYLDRVLEARTARTHVDPAALADELALIVDQGYAIALEEARAGACSIAVPVGARGGPVEAAVGVVTLATHAASLSRHLPVLRGVADRIDAAIARHPGTPLRPRT